MTEHAIIAGSLVDVRNVGTHKSVKLTIHVPEEYAMRVMEAFGWPTGVKPVAVAVARFNEEGGDAPESEGNRRTKRLPETQPRSSAAQKAGADKPKRRFDEMTPAQQAGMLCSDLAFQRFLAEKFSDVWAQELRLRARNASLSRDPADIASDIICSLASVERKRDIKPDNTDWSGLVLAYRLWQREPEYTG